MKALKLLCLTMPLLSATAFAQATFLFIWHGNSNFFQASFQVTDAEMQGAPLGSSDFTNSVSISSLSGITYNVKVDASLFAGGVNPWAFHITFIDFNDGTEVVATGGEPPRGAMAGSIEEKPISGSDLFFETGHWSYTQIPEPSATVLSIVGILCFLRRRATAAFSSSPVAIRDSAANPSL